MLHITNIYYLITISFFIHEGDQFNTKISSYREESVKLNADTTIISKNNDDQSIQLTDLLKTIYNENSDGIKIIVHYKKYILIIYFHN